jgi:hypothetical protein
MKKTTCTPIMAAQVQKVVALGQGLVTQTIAAVPKVLSKANGAVPRCGVRSPAHLV